METHFFIESETYAEKAMRQLARYHYRYQVRKVTTSAGCSYRFTVSGPPTAVFGLLSAQQIPYNAI